MLKLDAFEAQIGDTSTGLRGFQVKIELFVSSTSPLTVVM